MSTAAPTAASDSTQAKEKTLFEEVVELEKEYMTLSLQNEESQKKQFAMLQRLAPMQNRLLSGALKEAQDEVTRLKKELESRKDNVASK